MNNLTTIDNQPWHIPIDIISIIFCSISILLANLYLFVIIYHKMYEKISMSLVAYSCFSELVFSIGKLCSIIYVLQNDLQGIAYYDVRCLIYAYISYTGMAMQNYSYLLQAMYRYVLVVYPTRLFYRSVRFQYVLIILVCLVAMIYPIILIVTKEIKYNIEDQICQIPFQLSFINLYNMFFMYFIPIGVISLIYIKMVRYVRNMGRNVTTVNRFYRAQRELRLIQRIVLLVSIIVALGIPYSLFNLLSYFNRPQKDQIRISYAFVDASVLLIMVIIFVVTKSLRESFMKTFTTQRMIVASIRVNANT